MEGSIYLKARQERDERYVDLVLVPAALICQLRLPR